MSSTGGSGSGGRGSGGSGSDSKIAASTSLLEQNTDNPRAND